MDRSEERMNSGGVVQAGSPALQRSGPKYQFCESSSCVTSGELLNFSDSYFLIHKIEH